MTIADLGTLTIGAVVPEAVSAQVAIDVACNIAAPNVNAQLTAMLSFSPSLSIGFSAQLTMAASITANINAAISAIPPIPTITLSAQISMAAALVVNLNAMLASISAQVAISATLLGLLQTGGVRLLSYSGPQNNFGGELATALGSSTANVPVGLVLVATTSQAGVAMSAMFKVS